jgi:magnesium chelatase family protein
LLDRIDIQIEVDAVPVSEIQQSQPSECSAEVGRRVAAARRLQQLRYGNRGIHCNAQLDHRGIREVCQLESEAQRLLHQAVEAMHMSMRAYYRILKVARTLADLQNEDQIKVPHIAEAVQYRELDQKYWR